MKRRSTIQYSTTRRAETTGSSAATAQQLLTSAGWRNLFHSFTNKRLNRYVCLNLLNHSMISRRISTRCVSPAFRLRLRFSSLLFFSILFPSITFRYSDVVFHVLALMLYDIVFFLPLNRAKARYFVVVESTMSTATTTAITMTTTTTTAVAAGDDDHDPHVRFFSTISEKKLKLSGSFCPFGHLCWPNPRQVKS